MTHKLILTRGIQGSGKTTWTLEQLAKFPDQYARVNRDEIRNTVFGAYWGVDEQAVTVVQHAMLTALFTANKRDVISDDTHLNSRNVKDLLLLAQKHGYEVEHRDFKISLEEAIRRDALRERTVGVEVITNFYTRYMRKGEFPPFPVLDVNKKVDNISHLYSAVESAPKAFIVDIDGTIAKMVNRGPFEWTRVGEDEPIHGVIDMVKLLHANGHKILITSGRDGISKKDTVEWLNLHNVPFDSIFMRTINDMRPDDIVKAEIFNNEIREQYNVRGVLDDRLKVCRVWHKMGLTLFRVGDPDANF